MSALAALVHLLLTGDYTAPLHALPLLSEEDAPLAALVALIWQ